MCLLKSFGMNIYDDVDGVIGRLDLDAKRFQCCALRCDVVKSKWPDRCAHGTQSKSSNNGKLDEMFGVSDIQVFLLPIWRRAGKWLRSCVAASQKLARIRSLGSFTTAHLPTIYFNWICEFAKKFYGSGVSVGFAFCLCIHIYEMPFAGAANDSESVFVCLSAVNNLRRARIDNRSPVFSFSFLL